MERERDQQETAGDEAKTIPTGGCVYSADVGTGLSSKMCVCLHVKGSKKALNSTRPRSDDKLLSGSQQEQQKLFSSVSSLLLLPVFHSLILFLLYAAGSCSLTNG